MFEEQLRSALNNFKLEEAETLSLRIHQAEVEGYEITATEDRLWSKLTQRIMFGSLLDVPDDIPF